jgi:hypothetical protein
VAIIVAFGPPVITACLVGNPNRWEWFARSGSATAAVGLFWASRHYVSHSVYELARLRTDPKRQTDDTQLVHEISTAKLGLAMSAFGTIISGWGQYLGWWSFSFLIVWALFVARDAYRDLVKPGEAKLPVSTGDSP